MLNQEERKDILKKEKELRNLQMNIFEEKESNEEKIYYNPSIEEYKKNHSIKPKIIKGFIFCNYY